MLTLFKVGGPFMYLLVLTSIVGLAFILERGWALRWKRVVPPEVEKAVEECRSQIEVSELRQICKLRPSPLSRLLLVAAEHLNWPIDENTDAIQTRARHEILQLERGLVVLEIVVGIAPLLGLVGTVHGLITLFSDISSVGLGDNTAFAKGISEALYTTLAGLLIAIPSLVAWSYYTKKVESMGVEMETLCDEFLRRQYRQPKEA
jgi:biopolymer transport protein ExbB